MKVLIFIFTLFCSTMLYSQITTKTSLDIKTKKITIVVTNEFEHTVQMMPNPHNEGGAFKGSFYTIRYLDEFGKEIYSYNDYILLRRLGFVSPLESVSDKIELKRGNGVEEIDFNQVKTIDLRIDIEAKGIKKEQPSNMGIVFRNTILKTFNIR